MKDSLRHILEDEGEVGDLRLFGKQEPIKLGWLRLLHLPHGDFLVLSLIFIYMRKPKTIHYLYKTTCNVTNRYYIGMHSTNNLEDGYMGSGKRLRRSIRKYGEGNHTKEILGFYDTRELLVEAEIKVITPDMVDDKDCMNLTLGGNGSFETLNKRGLNNSANQCSLGGKKFSQMRKGNPELDKEYREKLSKGIRKAYKEGRITPTVGGWNKGKTLSDEHKRNIGKTNSVTQSGIRNSQYGTCWITKEGSNKKIKKEDLEQHIKDGWLKGRK